MCHDFLQGLQTRIQLSADTVPSLLNRDGAMGGEFATFTLSLPWCVVSFACVIYPHCGEKMPFGKFFNTSNLSCLGSEFSPRSIWKRHCSQDGLLSVAHDWTLRYWLIMYLKKSVTQFMYLCAVHLKYLFTEPKPAFLGRHILAEFWLSGQIPLLGRVALLPS